MPSRSAGSKRLELRVEADNVLNHAVFANPQRQHHSGTFGQITGILGGGAFTNSQDLERQLQLGRTVYVRTPGAEPDASALIPPTI